MGGVEDMKAEQIINHLKLKPHPEGGYYRETFRDNKAVGERGCSTAIYYLLNEGEKSHWHRVDAAEIWHFYSGSPLVLRLWDEQESNSEQTVILGTDLVENEQPQIIVPSGVWQSAEAQAGWTLVGCTVAPAFEFEHFEMAPDNWKPGDRL